MRRNVTVIIFGVAIVINVIISLVYFLYTEHMFWYIEFKKGLIPMKKRFIFHIDVNSAYLSWEASHRLQRGDSLDLRTVPSAIGGDPETRHGIILAKFCQE